MRSEYSIPSEVFSELEPKIKKLENKCKKVGKFFKFYKKGTHTENVKINDKVFEVMFIDFYIEGSVEFNDWMFIGVLEHSEAGNIVSSVDEKNPIPKMFYNTKSYCEHCNTTRYRKETFVIQNVKTGEYKQVGRTCLKDYTHGMDAEHMMNMLEGVKLLNNTVENMHSEIKRLYTPMFPTNTVLKGAFAIAQRRKAYVKRGNMDFMSNYELLIKLFSCGRVTVPEDKDRENIDVKSLMNINIDYKELSEMMMSKDNEFMQNIKVISQSKYCSVKDFGRIAYVPYALEKFKDWKKKNTASEKEMKSEWKHNVGDRISLTNCKVTPGHSYNTMYGIYTYYRIEDTDTLYQWKSTKEIEEGVYNITGTVLEHIKDKMGVKLTALTRCRLTK